MRKRLLALTGSVLVVIVAAAYTRGMGRAGEIKAAGTVESRAIRVGSRVGGRIRRVKVHEGDRVRQGDVLLEFEDQELLAAMGQARGRVDFARANEEKIARGARPEQIAKARAAAEQARAQLAQAERGYRREDIAQAQAEVDRQEADVENARRALARADQLLEKDIAPRKDRDDAEAQYKMAAARLDGSREQLTALRKGYRVEEVTAARARFEQAEAALQELLNGSRREDIAMARAEVIRAEGELRDAEARYRERQVLSPASARVEVLDVRPGDLIPPNAPIATLLESGQVYARIFIPETEIGYLAVGAHAQIHLDSFPNRKFEGEVIQINEKAEFLPRSVQTLEDRVHQFFGIKVRIADPRQVVRPGMAVAAIFERRTVEHAGNSR